MSTMTDAPRWTPEKLIARLERDNYAVERALLVLWYAQTESERAAQRTSESNGIGFSGYDAPILSSFCEQITKNVGRRPNGERLSPKQFVVARRALRKYARQLLTLTGGN